MANPQTGKTEDKHPGMFGERVAAFEAELTQALLRLEPSGVFREQLETEVLLAPKRAG